jgi:hypothetical protein
MSYSPRLAWFASLALAAAMANACSKSQGSGGPSVDDACMLDAQTYCGARVRCWQPDGDKDFRFVQSWGTLQGCMDARKTTCMADLQRASTGLSPARTESCAMALANQSCQDFLAGLSLPTSSCPPAIGQLDNGETCAVSAQCKSNYCDRGSDQVCGKCADKGGIGHPCDQTADCATGLACLVADVNTGMMTCMTPPAPPPHAEVDQACGTADLPACDTGLVCVGVAPMRVCKARLTTVGAACDPSRKTAPDCDPASYLWCNRMTMMCEREKLVDPGQPCNDLPDGSLGVCSGGSRCVWSGTRPVAGVCTPPVGENMRCFTKSADGPGCAPSLRCVLDSPAATAGYCRRQELSECTVPNPAPPVSSPDAGRD